MAVICTKRVELSKYKTSHSITKVLVKLSKKTAKHYAVTEDEEYIGMLMPDFDKTKPIYVLTFSEETEKGISTWDALGNYEPSAPEYTL